MNNYQKMKNRHPLRRDIILVIVLILLILTAIIFPKFNEDKTSSIETEVIYIDAQSFSESEISLKEPDPNVSYPSEALLLKEQALAPEIIPDTIEFEMPLLEDIDVLLEEEINNMKLPKRLVPKRRTPEEIWAYYYELYTNKEMDEFELGFNISAYSGPALEWGIQNYDTPASPRGGKTTFNYNHLKYPIELLKQGLEDTVKVLIYVEANGELKRIFLAKPSKYQEFNIASIIAVSRSEWDPGTKNGHKVPTAVIYPIVFNRYDRSVVVNTLHQELQRRGKIVGTMHFPFPRLVNGRGLYNHLSYSLEKNYPKQGGKIQLYAYVKPDSTVDPIEVLRSSDSDILDQAAIERVKECKFIPFNLDGVNIGVWTHVSIWFNPKQ